VLNSCFGPGSSASLTGVQIGDLVLTTPRMGPLADPLVEVPAIKPPKQLQASGPEDYALDFASSPLVDPALFGLPGAGLEVGVCNVSSDTAHTLNGVSFQLASFTAFKGKVQVGVWNACYPPVSSHLQLQSQPSTCASGGPPPLSVCLCFYGRMAFGVLGNGLTVAQSVGTTVDMVQDQADLNTPGDNLGKLPLVLAPGQSISLFLDLTLQGMSDGTYTIAFGMQMDGGAATFSPASPLLLFPSSTVLWTGDNCYSPGMLLGMPQTPTSPETYYICPPQPPSQP
jgi:hypothetical protein